MKETFFVSEENCSVIGYANVMHNSNLTSLSPGHAVSTRCVVEAMSSSSKSAVLNCAFNVAS